MSRQSRRQSILRALGNPQDSNDRRSQSTSARPSSASAPSSRVPCARPSTRRCSRGPDPSAARLLSGPESVGVVGGRRQPNGPAANLLQHRRIGPQPTVVERRRQQRQRPHGRQARPPPASPGWRRATRRQCQWRRASRPVAPTATARRPARPAPCRAGPAPTPTSCRAPCRSMDRAVSPASCNRSPRFPQSSLLRESMCTSTTPGAGLGEASNSSAAIDVPSADAKVTARPLAAAGAGAASTPASITVSLAQVLIDLRTSRYSRTVRPRPTKIARLMSAWPIDTSSRCGSVRNSVRLSQVEIVAGVDAQAELVRQPRGLRVAREARLGRGRPALERARERLGVELDAIGAHVARPTAGRRARRRRTGSRARRPPCSRPMMPPSASRGVSAGQPAWLVISPGCTGHQRALVRPHLQHELEQSRAADRPRC